MAAVLSKPVTRILDESVSALGRLQTLNPSATLPLLGQSRSSCSTLQCRLVIALQTLMAELSSAAKRRRLERIIRSQLVHAIILHSLAMTFRSEQEHLHTKQPLDNCPFHVASAESGLYKSMRRLDCQYVLPRIEQSHETPNL